MQREFFRSKRKTKDSIEPLFIQIDSEMSKRKKGDKM